MRAPAILRNAALGLAVVVGLAACEYQEVDGIGTRTADDAHPPQHDLAAFDGCRRNGLNQWHAAGAVVNHSSTTATYEVVVAFYDGQTRLDERSLWIRDLRPGERAAIDRGWWVDSPDRVTACEVLLVNRFG